MNSTTHPQRARGALTQALGGIGKLVAAAVVATILVGAVPSASFAETAAPVIGEARGSLTFQTASPSIPVAGADGQAWTVTDKITGASVGSGVVSGGAVDPVVSGVGMYTLTVGTVSADFAVIGETPEFDPYYGAVTHFQRPGDSVWNAPETSIADLKNLGFSVLRDESYWDHTELQRGVYALPETVERYTQIFKEQGIEWLFIADYGNAKIGLPGGSRYGTPVTPELQKAFADYVKFVIRETGVKRVEMWNEFNQPTFNPGCRTGTCYVEQFGPVVDMVREEFPDVEIIGGVTARTPGDWFDEFYAAGGLDYFDAVSYHPYGVRALFAYQDLADALRAKQLPYLPEGAEPKPVLITEVGWSTMLNGAPENNVAVQDAQVQAERLGQMFIVNKAAGVERVNWYTPLDEGTDRFYVEHNFGIYKIPTTSVPAFQPKESALAMWVMRDQLQGYEQTDLTQLNPSSGDGSYQGGMWRATYMNAAGETKLTLFADSPQISRNVANSHLRTIAATDLLPEGLVVKSAVDAYGDAVDLTGEEIAVSTRPVFVTLGEPVAPPVEVTPAAPTVAVSTQCGVPSTIVLPSTEGITYVVSDPAATSGRVGVSAVANEGYVLAPGAVAAWTVDLGEQVECPVDIVVTPAAPTVEPADVCEKPGSVKLPDVPGVTYAVSEPSNLIVTVTATADEGYVLADGATSSWTLDLSKDDTCPTPEPTPEPTPGPTEHPTPEPTDPPVTTPDPGVDTGVDDPKGAVAGEPMGGDSRTWLAQGALLLLVSAAAAVSSGLFARRRGRV